MRATALLAELVANNTIKYMGLPCVHILPDFPVGQRKSASSSQFIKMSKLIV